MNIQTHDFTQRGSRVSDAETWNTVILRTLGVALLVGTFAFPTSVVAQQEFIHFDCVNNSAPATDPLGVNELQCVPRNASVLGPATVHPDLEIISLDPDTGMSSGHQVVKIKAAQVSLDDATFGAPNSQELNDGDCSPNAICTNNCLEDYTENRVDFRSNEGVAFGFGDLDTAGGGIPGDDEGPVNLAFNFLNGVTVSTFSIKMFDYGDFDPKRTTNGPRNTILTLKGYSGGSEVASYTLKYQSTGRIVGRPSIENPGHYTCSPDYPGNCDEGSGPATNDLYLNGDACSASLGQPGYIKLEVSGVGIDRVELVAGGRSDPLFPEFPDGYPERNWDPNVGFDSIRFTKEDDTSQIPAANPCTIGFWKNRYDEKKGTLQHFSNESFEQIQADAVAICSTSLSPCPFGDEASLIMALTSKGKRSDEERSDQQLAALLLSLAAPSGNQKCELVEGNIIDVPNECGDATTVGDALVFIDAQRDLEVYEAAKTCADDINNGIGLGD